jgi:hypothetical protein
MADQLPLIDDDSIQWTKVLSKNGVPFEVGVKKTEHSIEGESQVALRGQPIAHIGTPIPVYWLVGDNTWKPTSGEVLGRCITRYSLFRNSGYYDNILYITNNQRRVFWFWDETGDYYEIDTYLERDHYVRYNSNQPTIRWVQ